ncbi:MAG: hypothetical protein K0S41_450 [Anaerocolumna sp.]|jgi:uncharacterized YigZ family protein|nr:hypothetical protein [Anaerocolumna sp.]
MVESYRCVYTGGVGEIIEKKSRFIATVRPIESEESALEIIESLKKQYWDAAHNCTAYVLGINDEIQRCSDDGEPAKTAGRPMLDVLLGEGIHNVLVVVTRYFGGTLLGTGGLVRAYQSAVKEGLNQSTIINKCFGKKMKITTDYNGIGKLQYIINQLEITTINTNYTEIVVIMVLVPFSVINAFKDKIIEATLGKALIEDVQDVYYANITGEIVIFD